MSQLTASKSWIKATKPKLQLLLAGGVIGDFYFLLSAFLHFNTFLKRAQVALSYKKEKTLPQAGVNTEDTDEFGWWEV